MMIRQFDAEPASLSQHWGAVIGRVPGADDVRTAMRREVETICPEASLRDAAQRMVDRGLSSLCVTEAAGRLVGMVAINDVLRAPAGRSLVVTDRLPNNAEAWPHMRVEQVMRRRVLTIAPDAPLIEAAARMVNRAIHPLPVVAEGMLCGIISRADILSALLRSATGGS